MIRQCIRDGRPLPKAIANAPTLKPGDLFYFNAYQELATCRPFETGSIPWTAIKLYADHCGQDDEGFNDLKTVVLTLDYLIKQEVMTKPEPGQLGN